MLLSPGFALGDSPDNENRPLFSERMAMCEKRLLQAPRAPSLYGFVGEATISDAEAEGVGVRMALAVDYNLWHFELRSFCAWFERVFGQIAEGSDIPPELGLRAEVTWHLFYHALRDHEDSYTTHWPLIAIHTLRSLERAARHLHNHVWVNIFDKVARHIAAQFGFDPRSLPGLPNMP